MRWDIRVEHELSRDNILFARTRKYHIVHVPAFSPFSFSSSPIRDKFVKIFKLNRFALRCCVCESCVASKINASNKQEQSHQFNEGSLLSNSNWNLKSSEACWCLSTPSAPKDVRLLAFLKWFTVNNFYTRSEANFPPPPFFVRAGKFSEWKSRLVLIYCFNHAFFAPQLLSLSSSLIDWMMDFLSGETLKCF